MKAELTRLYPCLMRVVEAATLDSDLKKAKTCFEAAEAVDCICEKRIAGEFHSGLLVYHLSAALGKDEWFDPLVPLIEDDLSKLEGRVANPSELVSAFRRKLLNDAEFDDVVYEIASAAIFSGLFDAKRLSLEEPLNSSTKKNPDVTGYWGSRKTRAEVTVVHDDWPPAYSQEAQEIVESASVRGGYTATLNVALTSTASAEGIRKLIEALYEARESTEKSLRVEGYEFSHRNEEFRSTSVQSPISYIEFDESGIRNVQGSAVERSTITKIEQTEVDALYPKREGVTTTADVEKNSSAYSDSPIGEKIYRTLEKKMLKQCEPGAVNVVVLGFPQQHNDQGVLDALKGSMVALVPLPNSSASPDSQTPTLFARTGLAPFVDLSRLMPEQAAAIQGEVNRFKRLSAVLVLRLYAGRPLATVFLNPNADNPLSTEERDSLSQLALERASQSAGKPVSSPDQ